MSKYYIAANVFCIIIFFLFLAHDRLHKDRQEKQIKFDRALVAFMLYFAADSFYAAIAENRIPRTRLSVVASCFALYVFMAAITYFWLGYVMAVEHTPRRNRPLNRFAVLFPFIVSTLAIIVIYIVAPQLLISADNKLQPLYDVSLIIVPCIYIVAVIFHVLKNFISGTTRYGKHKHLYTGFLPLMVAGGGIVQLVWLVHMPVFCYASTILMLIYYIEFMEDQISMDPLTSLNNRRQLVQYASTLEGSHKKNGKTYVVMIDVNDFKSINDNFGHAEGDNALIIISKALKKIVGKHENLCFLGRYGGDEFIIIVNVSNETELKELIAKLREHITERCKAQNTPYRLSIGVGYDRLKATDDTLQNCIRRADKKLYLDKKQRKGV